MCEIMMKAVDNKNWITISIIAVPLKACTAMAAKTTGVNVLTEELDLLFSMGSSTGENVAEWINQILEDHETEKQ